MTCRHPAEYGYRVDARSVFERHATQTHKARITQAPGSYVLWDPADARNPVLAGETPRALAVCFFKRLYREGS